MMKVSIRVAAFFPVWFRVQPVSILNSEEAIPVSNVRNNLLLFSDLKKESNWAGFFINAFNEFPEEDAVYLKNLMSRAVKKKR